MTQLTDSKRATILDAATRMFLTHGYSKVSMDTIAEAAPVSKPTLYNYFDGKPALFGAVIAQQCDDLLHALTALETSATDLKSGLTVIARACVDVVYTPESLRLFRLIIAEQSAFPDLGKLAYQSGAEPVLERIAAYLSRVRLPRGIRFDHLVESARLLLSMLMGDLHLQCLLGIKTTLSAREKERLVERVVRYYISAHHGDT